MPTPIVQAAAAVLMLAASAGTNAEDTFERIVSRCEPYYSAQAPQDAEARVREIGAKVRSGVDINRTDEYGNTALMSAVQSCPLRVIEKMVAVGARVDPVNAQGFTPLQMALVSGRWDVAGLLVEHGARLDHKAADALFFEKPTDPHQRALLERAIRP